MRLSRRVGHFALSLLVASGPSLAHAYTMAATTPTANSQWQANGNMVVSGQITWTVNPNANPPIMEPPPNSAIVFLHAGGAAGVVTNSANAALTTVQNTNPPAVTTGIMTYNANLNLLPTNPPIGGGNGANATYFVEAVAFFNGAWIAKTNTQILLKNG